MKNNITITHGGNRMKNIIKVGIAGFGMSARVFHAPFFDVDPRFQIVKVYERTTEKSKDRYPYVEVVHQFEDLLTQDIDLIVICTPNNLHYSMSKQALLSGKNVIVEKPMAITYAEALELCEIARTRKVMFSVYQNRRWDGDFLTVKKLIDSGKLGDIVDYETRFNRFVIGKSSKAWKAEGGEGINVLYDLGVHLIDQAVCLFGIPKSIYGNLRKERVISGSIDYFQVVLDYESLQVKVFSSETALGRFPNFAVWGTNGSFIKCGTDVQEQALANGITPDAPGFGSDFPENLGTLSINENGSIKESEVVTETGRYHEYYDNIFEVLDNGADLIVKPEQCAKVIRLLELATISSKQNCRIDVENL